jgi:hypothetical protein
MRMGYRPWSAKMMSVILICIITLLPEKAETVSQPQYVSTICARI